MTKCKHNNVLNLGSYANLSGKHRKTKKFCPNMAVEPPSPLISSMECINKCLLDTEDTFEDADKATDPPETPDNGKIDDSDDELASTTSEKQAKAKYKPPPTIKQLEDAMEDLEKFL